MVVWNEQHDSFLCKLDLCAIENFLFRYNNAKDECIQKAGVSSVVT